MMMVTSLFADKQSRGQQVVIHHFEWDYTYKNTFRNTKLDMCLGFMLNPGVQKDFNC